MITIYQADSDSSQNDINSAASNNNNNNNSFLALSVDSFLAQLRGNKEGGRGGSKGLSAYAEHCLEHMSRLAGNQFVMRRTI